MHCSKCGNENDADAKFCKKCGVKLGDQPVEKTRMGTPAKIGIGCTGLIGLFLVLVVVSNIGGNRANSITVGDSATIDSGGTVAALSATKDGYDELGSVVAAKDQIGLNQLEFAAKVFIVKKGVHVRVIDQSFTLRRVRILDGPHAGASGWLPYEYLK